MATTTSLLSSAASTRAALADYQDRLMAFQYENSAYTDSAFSEYSKYLQDRIDTLTTAGGVSNASKALSLTESLQSATKSNLSSSIQRENIQIMAGNASLTDKYNLVASQFVRAQSIGDDTLVQSLMSQAYSISQSIQLQTQQAADAAATNARANAGSEKDLATNLTNELRQFNDDYAHAGTKTATSLIGDFVKKMQPTLQTLGIHLQSGVQPNYFDIVDGVNRAIFQAYTNAGLAVTPYDSGEAQNYYSDAANVTQKIPTIYGTMNSTQLASAAANPNQFSYKEDPDFVGTNGNKGIGGKQNAQVGYTYNPQTGVTPTYASTPWITVPATLNNQIQALHLQTVAKSDNTIEVTRTNQTPNWLKQILPSDSTVDIVANPNGQLTFEADAKDGSGKALYTIAKDNTVWESSNLGDRLLFDPNQQTASRGGQSFWGHLGDGLKSGLTDLTGLISGHASAEALLNNVTGNYPPSIPMASVTLPSVSLPAIAPLPHISTKPAASQPVAPAPVYLQGGAVSVQGTNVNPQSGGSGGIRITGTTNKPIGIPI